MDRLLYVAMNGANQVMVQQATNNHNLANLNTVGFRADLDNHLSKSFDAQGMETRVYAIREGGVVSQKMGDVFTTGRNLDIAVDADGYIALQDMDGTEAYGRGGELSIGAGGILETKSGYKVMGDGGPIAIPPHQQLQIASDGTITIVPPGDTGTVLQIDRIKLVRLDQDAIQKSKSGLIVNANNAPAEADPTVTITSGALETSNVSPIDALVNMVSLSRQYELQVKLMKSAEELETTSTQLLRNS
jgi:flagellar basal-body rod protein FlgF